MKKLEIVLLKPSIINGFILAGLNSMRSLSYLERVILICLTIASTMFLLRKKIIGIYKENINTYSLWSLEFYSDKSVKKIFAYSYFVLLFVFVSDWIIISKFHISNFFEYLIYYTVLQFFSLLFLSYVILHFYHLSIKSLM